MSKTISKYLLTVALITMASLANVSGVSANPIPFGRPYVVMTTENMSIDIAPDHTVEMTGTYTFHLTYDEGYPFFWPRVEALGTVEFVDLDGGFYGIVSYSGQYFEPTDLPEEFQIDGLQVFFAAEPNVGASTHMWGTTAEIVSIEEVEEPWNYTMFFPGPPDAFEISILHNGEELDWRWTEVRYETTSDDLIEASLTALQEWPMFAWDVTMEQGVHTITVRYKHNLVPLANNYVLLYSLGTGRYTGWSPPMLGLPGGKPDVDVAIEVSYPSSVEPTAWSPTNTDYYPEISISPTTLSWTATQIWAMNDFIVVFREIPFGDADRSGFVDAIDIQLVINGALGLDINPSDGDVSGDGHVDAVDVQLVINASLGIPSDSDGDGLTNMDEVNIYSTHPYDADTDDDGMPDGWEVESALNPLDSDDATEDPDGDGHTNLQEYWNGTDPRGGFPPIILWVSPTAGPGGTVVTILGEGFDTVGGVTVFFGQVAAFDVHVVSETEITAIVPPRDAVGVVLDVTVIQESGVSTFQDVFMYLGASPLTRNQE